MVLAASAQRAAPPSRSETSSPALATRWALLDVSADQRAGLAALLTDEEGRRAAAFRRPSDCARYIVRRGRLRELLGARLGCPPRAVPLSCNTYGKPFVEGADFDFNLSHSCGLAFYVIGRGLEVGCDVEWRRPQLASRAAAAHFFSAREATALAAIPEDRWTEAFFNCWTRKEAFIKGVGLGVSYPLEAFDVSLAPGEPAALLQGPPGWSLQAFQPLRGLHVAIASRPRPCSSTGEVLATG